MDAPVRDWLPVGAFSKVAVESVFSDTLANWSTQWFPSAKAVVSAVRAGGPAVPSEAEVETVSGTSAKIATSSAGTRRLLQKALGVDLNIQLLWETDRNVLDHFVQEMLCDLLVRIDTILGDSPSNDGGTDILAVVAFAEGELFKLIVPTHSLVPLLKQQYGKPKPGKSPLNRIECLRGVRIAPFGHVGYADLFIAEVEDMSVGDVLVLDRNLGDPIELRLPDTERPLARGKLCRTDGQFSIQL